MVPKFDTKREMKAFLEELLTNPRPEVTTVDLLRVVYQFIDFAVDEDDVRQAVEQEVTDALESLEFETVDLKIRR